MTRKDYIAIAQALSNVRRCPGREPGRWGIETWITIRAELARMLATDNPRFDRDRFYAATEKEGT